MSANLRNPKMLIALALGGAVVLTAALWILLVGPERSKATKLDGEVAAMQSKIDERKAALASPKANVHIKASDVYRLTRAMPNETDMSGILLTLDHMAKSHKLDFSSIQPDPQVAQTGFSVVPAAVVLQGRFTDVSAFLGDVRKLVDVKRHQLAATGRLFSVDSVELSKPDGTNKAFPDVKATMTINAFVFTGGVITPAPSQTTPTASSGTVAAGANP
jgi:Tfp pilus assembly protein PilO